MPEAVAATTLARTKRLAGVAVLTLALFGTSGCTSTRISAPDAAADPDEPTFVPAPRDPADDPQLAALVLPEGGRGADPARSIREFPAALDDLSGLLDAIQDEVGGDARLVHLEVAGRPLATVDHNGLRDWTLGADGDPMEAAAEGDAARGRAQPFRLDDVAVEPIARLAAGLSRRVPGASVVSATLASVDRAGRPDPLGVVWRIRLTRGGASAVVVADRAGGVLRVETLP